MVEMCGLSCGVGLSGTVEKYASILFYVWVTIQWEL